MFTFDRRILLKRPALIAKISGSPAFSDIKGTVSFYRACGGTAVVAEIFCLPSDNRFYAMHIHSGCSCTGNDTDPFADAGTHLDLIGTEHPFHTGDLPSLLSNNGGYAWSAIYTDRFQPPQVRGCTVIIHALPDDHRTQPSGNAGEKIACGVIR